MSAVERLRWGAFRYRGLTPVPFLVLAVLFAEPVMWSLLTGFVLLCTGELLRLWAVSVVGSEARATRGAYGSRLITDGPFAYLRNPIYAGNLLIYAGVGVMSMALFPWLLIAGVFCFTIQYWLIISYEEDFLRNRFGEEYRAYAARVRRFLPRFVKERTRSRRVSTATTLLSEKRTLQAEILVVTLLVVLYFVRVGQG